MGTLIGYETINDHLKMICKNQKCGVEVYAGELVSLGDTFSAYNNPLFAHVCILCNSLNVEPVPVYE